MEETIFLDGVTAADEEGVLFHDGDKEGGDKSSKSKESKKTTKFYNV